MNKRLTTKEYWKKQNQNIKITKINKDYIFFDLLKQYLPKNSKFRCIEIGCNPGGFLIAMYKNFNYNIYGLDYNPLEITRQNFEFNKIKNFKLIEKDFLKYNPKIKFDVVSSFGFIEHFENPETYIKKMANITKKNGYLIMGLPNLRYFQFISHYILDKKTLEKHYLEIMDLNLIEKIMKKNNIKTIYNGYYETFSYTHLNKNIIMRILNVPLVGFSILFNKVWKKKFKNTQFTSKYFSPYIIYIGKKK
jgi:SAM-dependent methyltransferase